MIRDFLSNKTNLIGLIVVCYTIVIYTLHQHLTTSQVILVLCVMSLSNILYYVWGMGRGILLSEMKKGAWNEFYKHIQDEIDDTNKND